MSTELCQLSAAELTAGYRQKRFSPVEVVRALLEAIDRENPRINAFCLVAHESALSTARDSEARWMRRKPAGLLDGVPVSIKDLVLTRGWPTLKGSRTIRNDRAWEDDAPAVARLREQGAVILGKTTTSEFGWKALGDSPLTGITRNPRNLAKTPGGSSGGAAAAVAAGLGPLAIGSDGAGSIRIPAAFTGVFGFKATHGTIAAWPPSTIGTMSNVGPITRTATDAALMMEAIGRPDPRDPNVVQLPPSRYRATLEAGIDDLRIAYAPRFNRADVDEEVADGVARAVGMLETMGAHVEEIDPELGDIESAFSVLWAAGIESGLSVMTDPERQLLEPELDDLAKSARSYSAMDLLAAARTRELLGIMMNGLHERYDLLVMPAVCVPAFDVGRDSPDTKRYPNWWNWAPFSYPFNLTMQPAASIRCGWTDDALPIGLQIIGRRWADGLVLRACRALERILSGSGHAVPWI